MRSERIPLWQYLSEYNADRSRILEIVDRVFFSGRLILGSEVEGFERRFAAYCGASCGIGVNSGTDALFLALKALGIGSGDEVITVSNTAVPTVAAIRAAGALPVFVDVEEDSFLMDAAKIEAAVTPRTRAILPVHLYGQPADMQAICALGRDRKIAVIEDCAQATGAVFAGKKVGTLGTAAAFSFYPTKILGGYGDGGMVTTNDAELAGRVRRLRFYGMENAYYSLEEGYNSRLDEVQAAILDYKLRSLDEKVARRRTLAHRYHSALSGVGDLVLPRPGRDRTHQYYVYTIRTKSRDRLMAYLRDRGIESKINYPVPIHLMSGYRFLGYRPGSLPVTERLAGEILSLPLFPELSDEDADAVMDAVQTFFRNG